MTVIKAIITWATDGDLKKNWSSLVWVVLFLLMTLFVGLGFPYFLYKVIFK